MAVSAVPRPLLEAGQGSLSSTQRRGCDPRPEIAALPSAPPKARKPVDPQLDEMATGCASVPAGLTPVANRISLLKSTCWLTVRANVPRV